MGSEKWEKQTNIIMNESLDDFYMPGMKGILYSRTRGGKNEETIRVYKQMNPEKWDKAYRAHYLVLDGDAAWTDENIIYTFVNFLDPESSMYNRVDGPIGSLEGGGRRRSRTKRRKTKRLGTKRRKTNRLKSKRRKSRR